MKKYCFIVLVLCGASTFAQDVTPAPTKHQLLWHEMEFYLFAHFGPNTFTDKEWGEGNEPSAIFNPTQLDCRQWARIAKQSGAKGIIITAKHHDGFCLWPSKYSTHTVRESKWKNGKGDVLKELSQTCKEYGLKFGVYISPWDRNHPDYGTEKYNDVFVNMMKEIFTNYGPIWELWWDGANGEGPNGKKQVYDWDRFKRTVESLSSNTVIFSDIGPHIRWVGNEKGIAGETNWNMLDTAGFTPGLGAPPVDTLNRGNVNGKNWIPAECDVSIRPGWFYHKEEDDKVKTPEQLFDLYLKSVGRGANLLLNVPPDRRGRINENDSVSLIGFKKLRDENFQTDLLKGTIPRLNNVSGGTSGLSYEAEYRFPGNLVKNVCYLEYSFPVAKKINCIVLREVIGHGQQIESFGIRLELADGSSLTEGGTTIGKKRMLSFPVAEVKKIEIVILNAKDYSAIYKPEAYLIDEKLIEK